MADAGEYPLLALPAGIIEPPPPKRGGGGGQKGPSKARQIERLEPQFAELQRVLEARNAQLSSSALGAGPEHVLVFETNDAPDEFYRVVSADPNLEWLLDYEERVPEDSDFKKAERRKDKQKSKKPKKKKARPQRAGAFITKYVYMVMFNQTAIAQLLSYWSTYKKSKRMPQGLGAWSAVFRCLRDIRRWGPVDRLREAGLLRDALEPLSAQRTIPVELELWPRPEEKRRASERQIRELVQGCGGQVLDARSIAEIHYHQLRHQRLLSPGEGINALTVGALNVDASQSAGPPQSKVIPSRADLPAAYSRLGRGFRQGVKPDVLAPGGRQMYQPKVHNTQPDWTPLARQDTGHIVATPGKRTVARSIGTSNATALTSRFAVHAGAAIKQLAATPDGGTVGGVPHALLVRALVIHAAEWPEDAFAFIKEALADMVDATRAKDDLSAVLGYGVVRPERGVACSPTRATAVGGGSISKDTVVRHRIPLPEALHLHAGRSPAKNAGSTGTTIPRKHRDTSSWSSLRPLGRKGVDAHG